VKLQKKIVENPSAAREKKSKN